jgi:hypothetical protein
MNSINISILTEDFYNKRIKLNLNGFYIKYNSNIYLITLHHNLPIYLVKYNDITLDVLIDSCWNELLILENKNIKKDIMIHTNWCHILKDTKTIYIIKDNYKIMFNNIDYEFIEYNNLESGSKIPYITAKTIDTFSPTFFVGSSGCPVYMNEKLIGIFSRYNISNNKVYIIPILVVLKTLLKKDNNKICIPNKKIKKIDYYNVEDNKIFYKGLNMYIPLDTYYLLEGNINNKKCILENNEKILFNDTFDELLNKNSLSIIDNKYRIDYRLLTLLNKLKIEKSLLMILIEHAEDDTFINKDLRIITD